MFLNHTRYTVKRHREALIDGRVRCPRFSVFVSHADVLLFHRHFLFKTGTGTTPLFSTATPGYTMASGSVYSPPTRPLPRNTLSRSAFKFKKSSKYCSWKCTALCAVGVSVLLAVLLSYFIGKDKCVAGTLSVRWAVTSSCCWVYLWRWLGSALQGVCSEGGYALISYSPWNILSRFRQVSIKRKAAFADRRRDVLRRRLECELVFDVPLAKRGEL